MALASVIAKMGRGPDLSVEERALLHSKSRKRWDYNRGRVSDGGVIKIQESCMLCGLKTSRRAISRVVTEMSRQEQLSDEKFKETSEFTGVSYEDMDALMHPKVHHKSHIEKILFLGILLFFEASG